MGQSEENLTSMCADKFNSMPTCERLPAHPRHCDRVRDRGASASRDSGLPDRTRDGFSRRCIRPNRLDRRLRPFTMRAQRGKQRAGSSPGLVHGKQRTPASRTQRASPRQPANNDFSREHKCTEVAIIPNLSGRCLFRGAR